MSGQTITAFLSAVALAVLLQGCFTTVHDRQFMYREPVDIDSTAIRTDGYYYRVAGREAGEQDISILPLILWGDGTAALGFVTMPKLKFERTIDTYLREKVSWGAFRVEGDSIRFQFLMGAIGGVQVNTYRVVEYEGRVLGDTSIVISVVRATSGPQEGERAINRTYHFEPLPPGAKPDSSNWLHERYRAGDDS